MQNAPDFNLSDIRTRNEARELSSLYASRQCLNNTRAIVQSLIYVLQLTAALCSFAAYAWPSIIWLIFISGCIQITVLFFGGLVHTLTIKKREIGSSIDDFLEQHHIIASFHRERTMSPIS